MGLVSELKSTQNSYSKISNGLYYSTTQLYKISHKIKQNFQQLNPKYWAKLSCSKLLKDVKYTLYICRVTKDMKQYVTFTQIRVSVSKKKQRMTSKNDGRIDQFLGEDIEKKRTGANSSLWPRQKSVPQLYSIEPFDSWPNGPSCWWRS